MCNGLPPVRAFDTAITPSGSLSSILTALYRCWKLPRASLPLEKAKTCVGIWAATVALPQVCEACARRIHGAETDQSLVQPRPRRPKQDLADILLIGNPQVEESMYPFRTLARFRRRLTSSVEGLHMTIC